MTLIYNQENIYRPILLYGSGDGWGCRIRYCLKSQAVYEPQGVLNMFIMRKDLIRLVDHYGARQNDLYRAIMPRLDDLKIMAASTAMWGLSPLKSYYQHSMDAEARDWQDLFIVMVNTKVKHEALSVT